MKKYITILILTLSVKCFSQNINSSVKLNDSITISASVSKFIASNHKLDTCDTGLGWKTICLIDNENWFGSDVGLNLPKYKLDKLTIQIADLKIDLQTNKMFNPNFSGEISIKQFKLAKTETGYTLYAFFSDGAGGYTAHWEIIKGIAFRNVLSKDEGSYYWQQTK